MIPAVSTFGTTKDLTPRMMVLGLVIQQTDTVAGVARRLADQFASARFPPSSAYNGLPALAAQGHVRLVEEGAESSLNVYEGTSKGIKHLRRWLRSTSLPPTVRDALQGKLEFIEREDLVGLIGIVREEEKAHTSACNIAQAQVLQEQRSRLVKRKSWDWRTRLRHIQRKDEVMLWSLMSLRLERLRNELEELSEEVSATQRETRVG
jgi:DNA-binding PadR family transcriptional regulator